MDGRPGLSDNYDLCVNQGRAYRDFSGSAWNRDSHQRTFGVSLSWSPFHGLPVPLPDYVERTAPSTSSQPIDVILPVPVLGLVRTRAVMTPEYTAYYTNASNPSTSRVTTYSGGHSTLNGGFSLYLGNLFFPFLATTMNWDARFKTVSSTAFGGYITEIGGVNTLAANFGGELRRLVDIPLIGIAAPPFVMAGATGSVDVAPRFTASNFGGESWSQATSIDTSQLCVDFPNQIRHTARGNFDLDVGAYLYGRATVLASVLSMVNAGANIWVHAYPSALKARIGVDTSASYRYPDAQAVGLPSLPVSIQHLDGSLSGYVEVYAFVATYFLVFPTGKANIFLRTWLPASPGPPCGKVNGIWINGERWCQGKV
jgi:hypothetical protein